MAYTPRIGDAAVDLTRCLSASYGDNGFKSGNFVNFYKNAYSILKKNKIKISEERLSLIKICFKHANDEKLNSAKRREDLLLASNLLFKEHIKSL